MGDESIADHGWEVEAGIVRPYLFTGGRTRPTGASLAIEAMVVTTSVGRKMATTLPAEQRRIVEECRAARSVAELAAALATPLGVVRVLIADLASMGMVDVGDMVSATRPADDIDLLNRLIARVRAIPA